MKLLSLFIIAIVLMANMISALSVYTELESEQLLPLEPKYNKSKPQKIKINTINNEKSIRFIKLLMEFDVKNVKSPETQSIESLNGFHRNEKQSKKQKKLKEKGFFSHSVTSIINNVKKSFDSTVSTKKRNKSKSTKSNSSENPQGYYLQDSDVPTDSLEESNLPIIDNIPTKRNNLKAKILKNRKKHANKKHLEQSSYYLSNNTNNEQLEQQILYRSKERLVDDIEQQHEHQSETSLSNDIRVNGDNQTSSFVTSDTYENRNENKKKSSQDVEQLLCHFKNSVFVLKIKLKHGKNLAIRDIGGSSDPYAKIFLNTDFKYKSKIVFKNLNPIWNEEFEIKLPKKSLNQSINSYFDDCTLNIFIYDYDRGSFNDDLIGFTAIKISQLQENVETPLELELQDHKQNSAEYLGAIFLDLTLMLKNEDEFELTKNKSELDLLGPKKKRFRQPWEAIVNIILIEGFNLNAMDDNGLSDPYVKFRLGSEKYRSKVIRHTLNPKYYESFKLHIYNTNKMVLNVSVYDYDSVADEFMGKTQLDLNTLELEKTHELNLSLDDGAGTIRMLITITGTNTGLNNSTDIDFNRDMLSNSYIDEIRQRYSIFKSHLAIDDIGWLQVKIYKVEGITESDAYCTIELINQYVQTHVEYRTTSPEWNKQFELYITDINSIVEFTVLDEKNKNDFIGKVEIPLLNVLQNSVSSNTNNHFIVKIVNGKKRCYVLKDKKYAKAKGLIELEFYVIYNPIRAVLKTFNPRDEKYLKNDRKLNLVELKNNIQRIHLVYQGFVNVGNFVESCFKWQNPTRSLISFTAFIFLVFNFELYMLPLTFVIIFMKNYIFYKLKINNHTGSVSNDDEELLKFEYADEEDENLDLDSKREAKKGIREKINDLQEIGFKVQEALDYVASLGEKIINTFNFSVPWLSFLAIFTLCIFSIIFYLIPLRYIVLIWGINKFTKKFRKPPGFVDNTEILDFLSRVPNNKETFQHKEFKISDSQLKSQNSTDSGSNSKDKKKKKQ